MKGKEKIYDAFAELIYAVVMADGKISEKEKKVISEVIEGHSIKIDIQKYFESKEMALSVAGSFLNTFEVCKQYGKDSEYPFLLKIVEDVSSVSEGLNKDDDNLLKDFISAFKRRFL